MNLIAYSDSEDSGDEAPSVPQPAAKIAQKPAFQKVVDRSNPGKIKLNLPGTTQPQAHKDDLDAEAPPAKKARTGGGAFSGFNAMLPAPKKPQPTARSEGAPPGKRGLGKGLGAGVNLKTGSEPAFKREPRVQEEEYDEQGNPIKRERLNKEDFRAMLNLPPPKTERTEEVKAVPKQGAIRTELEQAPTPVKKPVFMPMSMARGKKKKPITARPPVATTQKTKDAAAAAPASNTPTMEAESTPKPKVSLFSISQETEAPTKGGSNGAYEPLLFGAGEEEESFAFEERLDAQPASHQAPAAMPRASGASHDLTNIASDLNLSESERRQLFGRKGRGPDLSSAKIVDFNTDTEYAHNEMLRQQGETTQHNALKSISGAGKNSLRSLVNVATTQKDALEDHFAQGRRNKKEAGNKYGW